MARALPWPSSAQFGERQAPPGITITQSVLLPADEVIRRQDRGLYARVSMGVYDDKFRLAAYTRAGGRDVGTAIGEVANALSIPPGLSLSGAITSS